jgi:predicted esterase
MTIDPNDPHAGSVVVRAGAPLEGASAAIIAIHGRGAEPMHALALAARVAPPSVALLAPAAAGRQWYPQRFLSDRSQNEPFLSSALRRIAALVEDAERSGIPRNRIGLMGFSQGACLSGEFAARHPARWGAVLMFSGALIGPPGTTWDTTRSLDGTPVFLGCGDTDEHIPHDRVEESAAVLAEMGAEVTLRLYPGMGHTVNQDEIAIARSLLERLAD